MGEPPARPYKHIKVVAISFKRHTFKMLTWNDLGEQKEKQATKCRRWH